MGAFKVSLPIQILVSSLLVLMAGCASTWDQNQRPELSFPAINTEKDFSRNNSF